MDIVYFQKFYFNSGSDSVHLNIHDSPRPTPRAPRPAPHAACSIINLNRISIYQQDQNNSHVN